MTNKLQKRLVGIITVITVSIFVLPILFSNKKYSNNKFHNNSNEFKIIPLVVSEFRDKYKIKTIRLINPKSLETSTKNITQVINYKLTNGLSHNQITQQQIKLKSKIKNQKLISTPKQIVELSESNKKMPSLYSIHYIIQLGVLRNATKVKEIIVKLRLSGYQVYSDPLLPINGNFTKIFVSLYTSKEKLQFILVKLKDLTGLQGQIYSHSL